MNGAESLVRTLASNDIELCFANPGTSEIHLVAALDRVAQIRCVLGLFEGVVSAAADGYARMAAKPACTLLHLGPGLANALANLHNASRAPVPIVNLVGQHAGSHLRHDTPLASDVEAIARPYSGWLRTSTSAGYLGHDGAAAIVAARTAPGQIATLVVPADVAWSEGGATQKISHLPLAPMPCGDVIEYAASLLASGKRTGLLIGGHALHGRGLAAAGRIAAAPNVKLFCPYPLCRLERGSGLPAVERIHYILEQAREQLAEFRQLILVGAAAPVAYFAYPGKSSVITSCECQIHVLSRPEEDCVGALEALATAVTGHNRSVSREKLTRPAMPGGEITLAGLSAAVGALLPENAIVVDESMTSGRGLMAATKEAPTHDWLGNTGGSIGIALPLAVGAALACPERPVLCLTADGSAMYTLQALWTMAREGLKVTTVVFANGDYAVLKREFSALGTPGRCAAGMFEIGNPELDWVQLARGMGVPSTRATALEDFGKALQNGFASEGPSLVEVRV
ncbi:MAG: acetolactate synthase large subunit [Acidobacteria bacterium]|nr:acetolactate synthase large subunit [Acidobacteriota bacterium]